MAERKGILSFLRLDGAIDHLVAMVESKIEIAKIEVREELAEVLAKGIVGIILIAIGGTFFLFLNLALALWIGELMQREFLGFFIVSGFYLVVLIVLLLIKDKIGLKNNIEEKLNKGFKSRKR